MVRGAHPSADDMAHSFSMVADAAHHSVADVALSLAADTALSLLADMAQNLSMVADAAHPLAAEVAQAQLVYHVGTAQIGSGPRCPKPRTLRRGRGSVYTTVSSAFFSIRGRQKW